MTLHEILDSAKFCVPTVVSEGVKVVITLKDTFLEFEIDRNVRLNHRAQYNTVYSQARYDGMT
jgi:hypothetical protein